MALDNYTDLQTAILNWLARPGDMLISGSIPDMIVLAEEEARDRLQTRLGWQQTTLTTTAGTNTITLPSMFLEARELVLQNPGYANAVLQFQTPEQLDAMEVNDDTSSTEDQPVFFTIEGPNFRFMPVPDAAYNIVCSYQAGIPALAMAVGGVNWLLTDYPSIYLFGALAEAEPFIGDDERLVTWLTRRDKAIERLLVADIKSRWGGEALQIKTDVGNP